MKGEASEMFSYIHSPKTGDTTNPIPLAAVT